MDDIVQIPADLTDVRLTRNRAAIVKLETQEELPDELVTKLAGYAGKYGWWTFSIEPIQPEQLVKLPPIPKSDSRKPSERLRAVIYVRSQQEGIPQEKFDEYYNKRMNYLIELEKANLDSV